MKNIIIVHSDLSQKFIISQDDIKYIEQNRNIIRVTHVAGYIDVKFSGKEIAEAETRRIINLLKKS